MFNLENAIQTWNRNLRGNPAFEDGDIAELESHLRDEIERLKAEGVPEKEAFRQASEEIGKPEDLGQELYKTRVKGPDATPLWKQSSWVPSLLPNYVKVAIRNFHRNFSFTAINVVGLATGLAACLLIFLFVQLEFGYDRFHKQSDRIYRVVTDISQGGNTRELAWSSPPLAGALKSEFPQVKQAVRIYQQGGPVSRNDDSEVVNVNFVDPSFFHIFDFKLSRGDAATALEKPGTIVISREQAERFFKDSDPMHKTLEYGDGLQLEVTGILARIPPNSHFNPEFLVNINSLPGDRFQRWEGINLWTYILLDEQTSGSEFEKQLPGLIKSQLGEGWASIMQLHLQSLTEIYFNSDRLPEIGPTGDSSYAYIFSGIGLLIFFIAGINFMNLETALSFRRAREVGIRKVMGVTRGQLVRQFLGESILLTLISSVVAVGAALLVLPVFNELSGYELTSISFLNPALLAGLLGISVGIGILAGTYPAFILSMFKPSEVLRGTMNLGSKNRKLNASSAVLRKGLVSLQFVFTVLLLAGTGVISEQLRFVQNKSLGFNEDQTVVIRLNEKLRNNYGTLKQQLTDYSEVRNAGASSQVPGVPFGPRGYIAEGPSGDELLTNTLFVDTDYLETMEIDVVAGRGFTQERLSDLENDFILNEAAVAHFGWPGIEEALGKTIRTGGNNGIEGRVIGIVSNFHYESLHNTVEPLIIRYRERQHFMTARIGGNRIMDTMDYIEKQWKAQVPDEPLVSWFMNDRLDDMYQAENRMSRLFWYFSGMAIIIACMGLFGLASHSIQRRRKEIGIRKVLGASASRILMLLTKEYFWLIIFANLIAWPPAYIFMNRWLDNFAYQTEISPWIFLLAGMIVIVIALGTVSFHSIRAAVMDPINSLRSE